MVKYLSVQPADSSRSFPGCGLMPLAGDVYYCFLARVACGACLQTQGHCIPAGWKHVESMINFVPYCTIFIVCTPTI